MSDANTLTRSTDRMKLAISSAKEAHYVPGRRHFFRYRDLAVTEATGGKMRAQVTSAKSAMDRATGWHYHTCDMQFVYILKGWVDLEFAEDRKQRFGVGDSVNDSRRAAACRRSRPQTISSSLKCLWPPRWAPSLAIRPDDPTSFIAAWVLPAQSAPRSRIPEPLRPVPTPEHTRSIIDPNPSRRLTTARAAHACAPARRALGIRTHACPSRRGLQRP